MLTTPKVSVVVPAYNVSGYIQETLISLELQTFPNFEVLVVDDGSSDDTAAIVKKFSQRDSRFQLLQKSNGGLSSARNYGIRHAVGEYIALLDGDDVYHKDKLATHVDRLDRDADVGVVYSASQTIKDDGRPTFISLSGKPVHSNLMLALLCKNFVGHGSNGVFRRCLVDEVGEFDEDLRSWEDVDFWLRIAATQKWGFYREKRILCYYRVRPSGLSFNLVQMRISGEQVIQGAYRRSPELIEPMLPTVYAYMYRYLARLCLQGGDTETARDFIDQAFICDKSIFIGYAIAPHPIICAFVTNRENGDRAIAWFCKLRQKRSMKSIDDESSDISPTELTSKNSLLKNGFWATYGAFATRFLALVNNLLLARLLLPSEFGVIGVAYIFWSFVNLFAQDTAASFIVYKGIQDKRYLNTTYTISLGIGLILAVALIATSPLIANFFGIPDLIWLLTGFAFNLVLSFYQSVYVGVLRSQMRFQSLTNLSLIAAMARVFSTVVSALMGLSYWSFLIGDMVSWVIASILARREVKYNFQLQIDKEVCSEVLSYSLGGTGYSLGYYVNANSDNFVVGKLLGTTSLGYYNLAYQLTMALPVILSQVVNQIGMSAFTQMTDDKQQENALRNVIEQIAVFITPIYALFFLIIDKQAISLIFGEQWIPVAALIPWLLVFAYFRVVNSAISSMLQAKGRPGVNAKVNLIIAPVAVIGFVIGAIQGKIIGVSISVAIILGIGWTFYWWWVGCKALKWSMIKILQPIFMPILFTVIFMMCSSYLPIIIKAIIFAIAYLIFIRMFQPKYFMKIQDFTHKGFLVVMKKYIINFNY